MNEGIIKASECNHPYWDDNRCIDCGSSRRPDHAQSIWATFQPTNKENQQ